MTVGIVLAGGLSTRMGVDKATLSVAGKPMVVLVADALWEAGLRPVECQGGDVAAIGEFGLFVAPDDDPGCGPLVAIRSALERHRDRDVVVVACDLVAIDSDTIRSLIAAGSAQPHADVVAVVADGRHHLVSWWRHGTDRSLGALIDDGVEAFQEALARLVTVDLPVDSSLVRNVNSPADLGLGE
ncbi:MAG: molybdenum cofactor guanylyltransferase [Ilumatobacteraceae bacterium]